MAFCICMIAVGILFLVANTNDDEPVEAALPNRCVFSALVPETGQFACWQLPANRQGCSNNCQTISQEIQGSNTLCTWWCAPPNYERIIIDYEHVGLMTVTVLDGTPTENINGIGFMGFPIQGQMVAIRVGTSFRIRVTADAPMTDFRDWTFTGWTGWTMNVQRIGNRESILTVTINFVTHNPDAGSANPPLFIRPRIYLPPETTITPSAGANGTVSGAVTGMIGITPAHTFTATPAAGFRVASWGGGTLPAGNRGANCVAGSNQCTVTFDTVDRTIGVTFESVVTQVNFRIYSGGGHIRRYPNAPGNYAGATTHVHDPTNASNLAGSAGQLLRLRAVPDAGWAFSEWYWHRPVVGWQHYSPHAYTHVLFPNEGIIHMRPIFVRATTAISVHNYAAEGGRGHIPGHHWVEPTQVQSRTGTSESFVSSGGVYGIGAHPAAGFHLVHWRWWNGTNWNDVCPNTVCNPVGHVHPNPNYINVRFPLTGTLHLWPVFARNTTSITASATAGGSVTPSGAQSGLSGSSQTFTATPNAGFFFAGWSGAATGTTNPVTVTRPNSGNVDLVANFTGFTGTVQFAAGNVGTQFPTGNVPSSQSRQTGQSWLVAGSHTLALAGHHLAGWYNAATGGQRVLNADGSVVATPPALIVPSAGATVTLTARWAPNVGTVTFSNGEVTATHPTQGNLPADLTGTRATTGYAWDSVISTTGFGRVGFTLTGFYTTASGTGNRVFNANGTVAIGANALVMPTQGGVFDLYARWNANAGNLRFNANAPTGPVPGPMPANIAYITGNQLPASVALPSNFGRGQYAFLGFYDSPTGGTRIFVPNCFSAPGVPCTPSSVTLEGDPRHLSVVGGFANVYARWSSQEWLVTFDTRGGTPEPTPQTVSHGGQVARPPNPDRPGGLFVRWERQDVLGVEFRFDEPITTNITLVAIFTPTVDNVIIRPEGGRGSVPYVPFTWGVPISEPVAPTRVGHVFSHWSDQPATETTPFPPQWNFGNPVFYSFSLYAIWVPEEHTVRIEWNDASGNLEYVEFLVTHGQTISSQYWPQNPIYPPYGIAEDARFLHWSMTPNGNQAFDFGSTAVTRSFTLHAVWTRGEIEPGRP